MNENDRIKKAKEVIKIRFPVEIEAFKPCSSSKCEFPMVNGFDRCWQHLKGEERNDIRNSLLNENKNFQKICLAYADLSHLDLSSTDLSGAILIGASLKGTRFKNAKLLNAKLMWCNLEASDFTNSLCNGVNLSGCNADMAIFQESVLSDCCAVDARFRHCNFKHALMRNVDFSSADLQHAILEKADMENATFKFANLSYANLRYSNMQFLQISMANLSNADISGAKIFGLSPWDCKTEGLIANDVIRKPDETHIGNLPTFLWSTRPQPTFILRVKIQSHLALLSTTAQLLQDIEEIYCSPQIWHNHKVSLLRIASVDSGTVDIKLIVDLMKENLAFVNTGLLAVMLYFSLGLKVIRTLLKEVSETRKELSDIRGKQLDHLSKEVSIVKESIIMVNDLNEKGYPTSNTQRETIARLAEEKMQSVLSRLPGNTANQFSAVHAVEACLPDEGLRRVLVLKVDSTGRISQVGFTEIDLNEVGMNPSS